MSTVAIIGCGFVGSTLAYQLYQQDICDILLLNHTLPKLIGNKLDIMDTWTPEHKHHIISGTYDDLTAVDIVVNCSGNSALLSTQDRFSELPNSIRIANELIAKINNSGFSGVFINATNPCDEITALFGELSIPDNQIIGSGTLLETQRLRSIVFHKYNYISDSYIVGLHGNVNTIVCLDDVCKQNYTNLITSVQHRVWDIYNNKGYTNFGICSALISIIEAIIKDSNKELCVTTLTNPYSIKNRAVSIPCIIGSSGIKAINTYKEVSDVLNTLNF